MISGLQGLPTVWVVVLNYNGKGLNKRCLSSLLRQDYPALNILFVDNGSTDDSLDAVRTEFGDQIEYLINDQNYYFAKGCNLGIDWVLDKDPSYIFLVNNDTETASDCVTQLVSFMERTPSSGGCQPLLVDMDASEAAPFGSWTDTVASAGGQVSLSGRCWDIKAGKPVSSVETEPHEVPCITGGAMFLPASVVRDHGGFDPEYVMYYEDMDLSFRIRKSNRELFVVPQALMGHVGQGTSAEEAPLNRIRMCETNSYRLISAHFPSSLRWRALGSSIYFSCGATLLALLLLDFPRAWALTKGTVRGLAYYVNSMICGGPGGRGADAISEKYIRADVLYPPRHS